MESTLQIVLVLGSPLHLCGHGSWHPLRNRAQIPRRTVPVGVLAPLQYFGPRCHPYVYTPAINNSPVPLGSVGVHWLLWIVALLSCHCIIFLGCQAERRPVLQHFPHTCPHAGLPTPSLGTANSAWIFIERDVQLCTSSPKPGNEFKYSLAEACQGHATGQFRGQETSTDQGQGNKETDSSAYVIQ